MNENLQTRIHALKEKRNAVILAHNYQPPEIQDIADFVGDSLELSRNAAKTEADIIVFCGVRFMAETASILSPDKIVLLPAKEAGCPMADMITAAELRVLKSEHPGATVACYVNSSAEVKAESDICCTSSNAVDIVRSLQSARDVIFVPDQYLGQYVEEQTGRRMILWRGYCPTHVRIRKEDIEKARRRHPQAVVMVHPECPSPTRNAADFVLSTGGMIRLAHESSAAEFIVGTEIGILHRLQKENPEKQFWPATETAVCPNMKRTTLERLLWALERMQFQIKVPDDVGGRARKALESMVGPAKRAT